MADLAKRTYEFDIKIAADSIDKLRSVNVYRVLDSVDSDRRRGLATYIRGNRPDLADEVDGFFPYLGNENVSTAKDSMCDRGA